MRKFLSIILCFVIILSVNIVTFASESKDEPRIDPNNTEVPKAINRSTGTSIGLREATEEEKEKWAGVEKPYIAIEKENIATPFAAATWYQLSPMSNFYYYGQELDYSCSAACARMALNFLTGRHYTEGTVRAGCKTTTSGTSLSNVVTYLNSEQKVNYYIAQYDQSKETMKNNLYSGIVNFNAPPIIGLRTSVRNGWRYDLFSHSMIVYSALSDKSKFSLCDPWAGYVGNSNDRWLDMDADYIFMAYFEANSGYTY